MSMEQLNKDFEVHSYLGGSTRPTLEDYKCCKDISSVDASKFPHLARWHAHISQLMKQSPTHDHRGEKVPAGAQGAGKAPTKAQSPKQAPKEAAPKTASPKTAPKASAGGATKGDVEAEITSVGDQVRVLKEKLKGEGITGKKLNDNEDVKGLVAKLQELKTALADAPEGPAKAKAASPKASPKGSPKTAPKASAGATKGDVEAEITSVGDQVRLLKEKLKGEGITGKKLNDNADVKGLVAKLQELKTALADAPEGPATAKAASPKASPKGAPKKEAAPKKGAKAPAEVAAADPEKERKDKLKKVIKEGGKRGVEIEGAADMGGLQFFCTSVDLPDGDIEMLMESMKAMNEKSDPTEEERKGGSGHVGKMIFSAGSEQLAVVAYVPKEKQGELECKQWLEKVLSLFHGKVHSSAKDMCSGFVTADGNKNIFPLKIREPMIIEANNFLRKLGLFPEDHSDSDEMVFGDDDFPSM